MLLDVTLVPILSSLKRFCYLHKRSRHLLDPELGSNRHYPAVRETADTTANEKTLRTAGLIQYTGAS